MTRLLFLFGTVSIIIYSLYLLKPQGSDSKLLAEKEMLGLNSTATSSGTFDWVNVDDSEVKISFECFDHYCDFSVSEPDQKDFLRRFEINDGVVHYPILVLYPSRLGIIEAEEDYYLFQNFGEIINVISKSPAPGVNTSFIGTSSNLERLEFVSKASAWEKKFFVNWKNEVF